MKLGLSLFYSIRRILFPYWWFRIKILKENCGRRARLRRSVNKIYLYSFGGCGTKTLYHFAKQYSTVNSQLDIHEGCVTKINPDDCVVYLYGDPIEALLSFYRRNGKEDEFLSRHAENLGIFSPPPSTIEEYAALGVDFFELEKHFDRGIEAKEYEKLLINYSHLWSELDTILRFIKLEKFEAQFPKYEARTSRKEFLEKKVRISLEEIYRPLNRKIALLEPVTKIKK